MQGGVFSCVRAQDTEQDMQDIMDEGCLVDVE